MESMVNLKQSNWNFGWRIVLVWKVCEVENVWNGSAPFVYTSIYNMTGDIYKMLNYK